MINDILEMARLDNGKVEHVQETFTMAKVAPDTSDIFAAQAELEQKFFDSQLMLNEDEMVSGDLQLQQILNNILSNALKYTKAHGKISSWRVGSQGTSATACILPLSSRIRLRYVSKIPGEDL